MIMKKNLYILICLAWMGSRATVVAQDVVPTIDPYAISTNDEGEEETGTSFTGSAPKAVQFYANAQNVGGWDAYYEWRFYLTELDGSEHDTPYLVRYDEDTDYTFTKAGLHKVMCFATFTQGNDTIRYTEEFWNERNPMTVSISESRLEMPNAFSPNGDEHNPIYKAKEGYQSLVEFRATIYNRWGQKLYEWTDPAGGWDGTYNGKPVKQGVYFCLVKAKGADGRKFVIRTDVNLLRGYTEDTGVNSME